MYECSCFWAFTGKRQNSYADAPVMYKVVSLHEWIARQRRRNRSAGGVAQKPISHVHHTMRTSGNLRPEIFTDIHVTYQVARVYHEMVSSAALHDNHCTRNANSAHELEHQSTMDFTNKYELGVWFGRVE